MDPVIEYLETWTGPVMKTRAQLLVDTYRIVKTLEPVARWRFVPGESYPSETNPHGNRKAMHCAFGGTPFADRDLLILRCVENQPTSVAIGFCPDYGSVDDEAKARRAEIREDLPKTLRMLPVLGMTQIPQFSGKVHAYKGFEVEFPAPPTARDLAAKFVSTVTSWERLFAGCARRPQNSRAESER